MKKFNFIFILIIFLSCGKNMTQGVIQNDRAPIIDADKVIASKVQALISKMTIEDKVGEMTQLSLDMVMEGNPYAIKEPYEFNEEKLKKVLVDLKVGSILNNGGHTRPREEWHHIISVIQDYAINKKSTGIPVIYGIDAIHGANYVDNATMYPQQLNLAATWNTELVKELSAISAYETKAAGIPWAFAPVLDVGRDPRWSRMWETFGEDVHLVEEMGKATFEGMQGNDISDKTKLAACMKHFLGYSTPRSGKDRTPSYVPERQLREIFLSPFKAAIDSGARTVMINSGEINGIPVHANPKLLKDLLRDELGFTGIVVTDWEDIRYLFQHHRVAKDYKDAIRIAINAGIDMSMVPVDLEYNKLLVELVNEGKVPMSRINESVKRILTVKYELGLFDENYLSTIQDHEKLMDDYNLFGSVTHRDKALEAARESIVLLKNENNILPLKNNANILVTGPTANSLAAINGAWTGTWQGRDPKYDSKTAKTNLEGLQWLFKGQVTYVEGTDIDKPINIEKAVQAAKQSSVAIICIGEMPYVEGPGNIHDLTLPLAQIELVKAVAATNTPIVLVFNGGRPRIIREIEPLVDAVVYSGLPGNKGGTALAQLLSGSHNFSGRLPFTFPRYVNDLKLYDHKGTEIRDRNFGSNGFNPQWEFADGLSYATYKYNNLIVENKGNGNLKISVDISFEGKPGKLVVPLFINDKVATVTPSLKKLRKFKLITLSHHDQRIKDPQTVSFNVSKDDLKFIGVNNKSVFEAGEFEIEIGGLKKIVQID